jgi:hypothetical protein
MDHFLLRALTQHWRNNLPASPEGRGGHRLLDGALINPCNIAPFDKNRAPDLLAQNWVLPLIFAPLKKAICLWLQNSQKKPTCTGTS